jgi:steroid 5-alpha reductase family enzyme
MGLIDDFHLLVWDRLALFVFVSLSFLVAWRYRRADVADVSWGLGFILLAWFPYFFIPPSLYSVVISALVSAWGARLALHIFFRLRKRGEDFRYAAMRPPTGQFRPLPIYLKVFLFQGVLLYIVALPLQWIHVYGEQGPLPLLFLIVPMWLLGFVYETVADWQLSRFLADPSCHGRLLKTGLWQYSRHPNYFGELLQWWAIGIGALPLPHGWISLAGPLLLTFLLLRVSGVPPLEKKLSRHSDFADYARTTPLLIPRLSRRV